MRKQFLAIAVAALTLGFASCAKENTGGAAAKEGKATSMKVSLSFPTKDNTRATDDPNGTDNESQINVVDVFIYNAGGALSSSAHLTASDFTQAASTSSADAYKYTASTRIPTTTGAKTVFVGINLPATVVSSLKSQTESALYSAVQTMSRTELAGATNFAMFSVAPVTSTFVEDINDDANNLTVTCQRLVAKVTVETDAAMTQAGAPGILGDLKFAINNFNTKLFMVQNSAPEHKDPNWASGTWVAGDFNNATPADCAPILSRALIPNPTKDDYSPRYAAENTSQDKLQKELTRATVRATFIPKNITKFTNGTDNSAGYTETNDYGGVVTAKTFYAVTPSVADGTSYFFDAAVALAFSQEKSGSIITYTDGYCYWNIYLNKTPVNGTNLWDVLRNDYYKCNITRIVAPGRSTPDVTDPNLPPDQDTSITTDILLKFWNTPIISNYSLE